MNASLAGITIVAALALAAAAPAQTGQSTSPRLDPSGTNLQPNYPASALPAREQGAIVLNVEVTESGKARGVRLLQSTGFLDLDRAAIDAVLGWHFIPATTDGKPAAGHVNERIVFAPPDSPASQASALATAVPYLPPSLTLTAGFMETVRQTRPLPCSHGSLMAMVKFDSHAHANSAAPRAVLELSAGSWHVAVAAMLAGMLESRAMLTYGNDDGVNVMGLQDAIPYHPTALIISWNPLGDVIVPLGPSDRRNTRMTPPVNFGFAVTSATATFSDIRLICWAPDVVVE
jgi:TonB family protein